MTAMEKECLEDLRNIAKSTTDVGVLIRLIQHELDEIAVLALGNANVTCKMYEIAANDQRSKIRIVVASDVRTPGNVLDKLSKDSDVLVRIKVANNPNIPIRTVIDILYYEEDKRVLVGIAKSEMVVCQNICEIILERNDKMHNQINEMEMASNPDLPVYAFDILSEYRDVDILEALAKNPNTPRFVLLKIIDRNWENRELLKLILEHPAMSDQSMKYAQNCIDWILKSEE